MSIAELSDAEMHALMTLRAQRYSWVPFATAVYPREFKAACDGLAPRGLVTIDGAAAQITDAGMDATITRPQWGQAA